MAFSTVARKTPCLFKKFTVLSIVLWNTQPLGSSWLAFGGTNLKTMVKQKFLKGFYNASAVFECCFDPI